MSIQVKSMQERKFLFLQGPIGGFFKKLSDKLQSEGHKVLHVNFNGGDRFFWNDENCIDYTLPMSEWQGYISDIARLRRITDLVVFGDCRPVHKQAIEALAKFGVNIHVFEEGYMRPNWITLEQGGVNGYSPLPRDPMFYMREKTRFFDDLVEVKKSFRNQIVDTIRYYLASVPTLHSEFKNYEHHFGVSPHSTMASWIPRMITSRVRKLFAKFDEKRVFNTDYFLVALQLERDWQIKEHSKYANLSEFSNEVIKSFEKHAPEGINLVFKNHPLDNGTVNIKRCIEDAAARYNISDRVKFIDGGTLGSLLQNSKGLVTINSTSGLSALEQEIPVITMGNAVYDIEGLTNQCTLDIFWKGQRKSNPSLYKKFKNYMQYKTQINGSFYSPKYIDLAVENSTLKILGLDGTNYYEDSASAN